MSKAFTETKFRNLKCPRCQRDFLAVKVTNETTEPIKCKCGTVFEQIGPGRWKINNFKNLVKES